MCTSTCWVFRCPSCNGVVTKDTSVSGHTCKTARRNRNRGCCRTGIEYTYYNRPTEELCVLCELLGEIRKLTAETCDEAMSESRVGYTSVIYGDSDPEIESEDAECSDSESESESENETEDDDDDDEGGAPLDYGSESEESEDDEDSECSECCTDSDDSEEDSEEDDGDDEDEDHVECKACRRLRC